MVKKSNTKDFIEKANIVHNNFYNYLKTIYVNCSLQIIIICPIHGEFLQTPTKHLSGQGCLKCGIIKNAEKCRKNKKEFIKQSNIIHNNFYNYSKIIYINNKTKLIIICPIHGVFLQTPSKHLLGRGCSFCNQNISKEEISFINFLKEKNNSEYDLISQKDEEYPNNIKNIRKQLKRCYRPDLLLKKGSEYIVVEYNGDFWHKGNGNDIHPKNKKPIKEIIEKEKKRIKDFNSIGIDVIPISSSEWKNFINIDQISKNIQKIAKLLNWKEE